MSIAHLKILVQEFDRTANMVLSKFPMEPTEIEAVSRIIDTMRMVNTGNLEWRFVVAPFPLPPSPSFICDRYVGG